MPNKQKVTNSVIAYLMRLRTNKTSSLYAFVKELFNVKEAIVWRKSQWGSFEGFCQTELQLSYNHGTMLCSRFKQINKFAFTQEEITTLLSVFSFDKLGIICKHLPRKIKVATIIRRYKYKSSRQIVEEAQGNTFAMDEHFSYALPPEYAAKLNRILIGHGMAYANQNRVNVSKAVMSFLDAIHE